MDRDTELLEAWEDWSRLREELQDAHETLKYFMEAWDCGHREAGVARIQEFLAKYGEKPKQEEKTPNRVESDARGNIVINRGGS